MAPKIEIVTEGHILGEGPHWDIKTQSLYFVDIPGQALHKYTPSTKKLTKAPVDGKVTFIIPVQGRSNEFIISKLTSILRIYWDGESDKFSVLETLCEVDSGEDTPDNSFNDGKCDALGRLWAGTVSNVFNSLSNFPQTGSLYSLDENKQVRKHLTHIRISNGLTWNITNDKMYFIDSSKGTIDQFDFDLATGTVSNLQPIFTLSKHNLPGYLDGMTIDTDGNLWAALFKGYRVIKVDPRQPEILLDTIELPVEQVTSVAFGGLTLNDLYVTTGRWNVPGEENNELKPPNNGATYRITGTGAKGLPGVNIIL